MENRPSLPTIKALFARSYNRCAFNNCSAPLIEETGIITGEICHIKAAKQGGPRYDSEQSEDERHAASNLILLCSRHHKIIDSDPKIYPTATLAKMKLEHEQKGVTEITPKIAKIAEDLLASYTLINIIGNIGQVAIHSPGTIQANTINFNNARTKVSVSAPPDSIGASQQMVSYCTYLINRYQGYQKQDFTGKTNYKYQAIHNALKRKFKSHWKFLPQIWFPEVVLFLQSRIDATIIGKMNKAKGHKNYDSFDIDLK